MDLNKLIKKLKSDFKSVSVTSEIQDPKDYVSIGNRAFDIISDGGIPFGYCVEFLGLSQSGKSTFMQMILANAQKNYNAVGIMVDRENAWTNERALQLGIDIKRSIIVKPSDIPTVTDAFNFIIKTVSEIRKEDKDEYIVICIDSIAAFSKDVALEKSDSGRKAKAVHEGLRAALEIIDSRVMLLVANQVTWLIGMIYGDPRTSTAGESMKYYSTLRFALEDKKLIKDPSKGNEVVGNWIGVEVIKTRLGPCYRTIYVPHFYDKGIPYEGGYTRLLVDRGYLSAKNASEFKSFKQKTIIYNNGKEKIEYTSDKKLYEEHPELIFESYPEYKK